MIDPRLDRLIGTGDCVVDLGCESGELLRALADQFDQRIGLDVSKMRIDLLAGRSEGWRFQEADLNLPFSHPDEIAGTLITNTVIKHIVDPGYFAKEIESVLRPGGRCVITSLNILYVPPQEII